MNLGAVARRGQNCEWVFGLGVAVSGRAMGSKRGRWHVGAMKSGHSLGKCRKGNRWNKSKRGSNWYQGRR